MSKLLDQIEQNAMNAMKRSRYNTMSSSSSSSGGISFTGALTVLFIGLKLVHVINWSWWWVLSPIWISALIVITFLIIFLLFAIIIEKTK